MKVVVTVVHVTTTFSMYSEWLHVKVFVMTWKTVVVYSTFVPEYMFTL